MKYFSDDEFKCKCSANDGAGCGMDITDELKNLLDRARQVAGVPFIINSGARDSEHNRAIGGRFTSSHTKGLAVDIKATGSRERFLIVRSLMSVGFTRIGIDKGFVHADICYEKEQDVMWMY